MTDGVTNSRFYMFRAVFALAHADNFLALEEQDMLYKHLDNVPFSEDQLNILQDDVARKQDVDEMFDRITDPADIETFFKLAEAVVWSDGSLSAKEGETLDRLREKAGYTEIEDNEDKKGILSSLNAVFKNGGLGALLGKVEN